MDQNLSACLKAANEVAVNIPVVPVPLIKLIVDDRSLLGSYLLPVGTLLGSGRRPPPCTDFVQFRHAPSWSDGWTAKRASRVL